MKIAFIGAGNMATAIIKSIINSNRLQPCDLYVYDKCEDKSDALAKLGVNKSICLSDACNNAEIILIAVKPQDYDELLSDIKSVTDDLNSKTFISIAAAISCDYINGVVGANCGVVRVMPNTPLLLGVGATAMSRNSFVSDKLYSKICTLFAVSGYVCSLDESLMNKVISVNSSSPVFLYMLAKAMVEKAVEYGISEKHAQELVNQTLKGSVEMLIKSGKSADDLIKMVASPGGTTIAAISSLDSNSFFDEVKEAMDACTNRANELSK